MNKELFWVQGDFFDVVEPLKPPEYPPDASLEYFYLTQGFVAMKIRERFVPYTNSESVDNLSLAFGWYEENIDMFDENDDEYVLAHTHNPIIAQNIFTLRAIHLMSESIKPKLYSEKEGFEKWVAYYVDEEGLIQDLRWVLSDSLLKLKTYPYLDSVDIGTSSTTASLGLFNKFFWEGEDMDRIDMWMAHDYLTRYLYMIYAARILSRYRALSE